MSRSRILSRIHSESRASQAPALPEEIPSRPAYSDPVAEFVRQSKAVDVKIQQVGDHSSLCKAFASVLKEAATETLFWESPEIFEEHAIPHRFRDPAGFGSGRLVTSFHFRSRVEFPLVLNTRPFKRASIAAIELAVLHGSWGIAETGTIGLQVHAGKSRTLPILPPSVLILVRKRNIASNLSQVFEHHDPSEAGSILTLSTGPSRTADIEKTLVIGVHGPKQVYVVVTDLD